VLLANLKMPLRDGIRAAADMQIQGVHLVTGGETDPAALDSAGRRALLRELRDHGLEVSALVGWGGEVDLGEPGDHTAHIEDAKRCLELAVDLECRIWTAHCGVIPIYGDDDRWHRFVDAFGRIAAHAQSIGAILAIETGPEPPFILLRLIQEVGSPALAVNYDPANLIMWPAYLGGKRGEPYDRDAMMELFQPNTGPLVLGPHIVHTHAKDALVRDDGSYQEVPLGQGWVDWPRYLAYLRAVGYQGYFAVERETGDDPVGDITRAVQFLRQVL